MYSKEIDLCISEMFRFFSGKELTNEEIYEDILGKRGSVAIYCSEKETMRQFIDTMRKHGRGWANGERYCYGDIDRYFEPSGLCLYSDGTHSTLSWAMGDIGSDEITSIYEFLGDGSEDLAANDKEIDDFLSKFLLV